MIQHSSAAFDLPDRSASILNAEISTNPKKAGRIPKSAKKIVFLVSRISEEIRSLDKDLQELHYQTKNKSASIYCQASLQEFTSKIKLLSDQIDALTVNLEKIKSKRKKNPALVLKILELQESAQNAFNSSLNNHSSQPEFTRSIRKKLWLVEMIKIQLVCELSKSGFSAVQIENLTGLKAANWLYRDKLPRRLALASRSKIVQPYKIPVKFDEDSAFIIGAYCSVTRVFTAQNAMVFKADSVETLSDLRERFKRAFKMEISEPVKTSTGWCLNVVRRKFTHDLLKWIGASDQKDILIPAEIIKYPATATSFLLGFLSFCRGNFSNMESNFSISRFGQSKLLKAVAIVLYYHDMLPTVNIKGSKVVLRLWSQKDQAALIKLLQAKSAVNSSQDFRTQYKSGLLEPRIHYYPVMRVLGSDYPKGTIPNYSDILLKAGIIDLPQEISVSAKKQIQYWRNGKKPPEILKLDAINDFFLSLYPEIS